MLHHMGWGNYSVSAAVGVQDGHKQYLCETLPSENPCVVYKFRFLFIYLFLNLKANQNFVSCVLGPVPQTLM